MRICIIFSTYIDAKLPNKTDYFTMFQREPKECIYTSGPVRAFYQEG